MTPTAPAASLVRSTLGSLSEGAAEQSEAEGVYFVGCCKPMVFPTTAAQNWKRIPLNVLHSLSQPVRADSSLREGAKAAAPHGS